MSVYQNLQFRLQGLMRLRLEDFLKKQIWDQCFSIQELGLY